MIERGFSLKSVLFFTILTLSSLSFNTEAFGQCSNITNGGTINGNQTNCGTFNPTAITSVVDPSGGVGPVEYVWMQSHTNVVNYVGNPHWSSIPNSNSSTFDPGVITQTTYYLRCARNSGCGFYAGESNVVTMEILSNPTVSISTTKPTCNNGNNGTATASATGGNSPYTYAWSNGATTASVSGLSAGTYSVTVTDANGCSEMESVVVNNPPCCNVTNPGSIGGTQSGCGAFNPTTLNSITGPTGGLGNMEIVWIKKTPGNSWTTIVGANGLSYDPGMVTETTIFRRCARRAGCNSFVGESNNITITVFSSPNASVSTTNATCNSGNDGTASASASGGNSPYTYAWSNGATTASISGLTAGNYSVTVTDANGCSDLENVVIGNPPCCNVTNPGSIGGTQSGCGSFNPTTLYSITDPTGGLGNMEIVWIKKTPGNSWTTIAGANGLTYDPGVLTETTLFRRCSRRAGCNSFVGESNIITITILPNLTLSASSTDVSCYGGNNGTATATVSGGTAPYTYSWSNGANTATIPGLTAGTYSVIVTGANGCSSISTTTTVNEPTLLNATMMTTNITCNGNNNGSASVNASGGTAPYTYLWNNGATTSSVASLTPSTYSVIVTDANGCSVSDSNLITEPTLLISTTSSTNISCNGGNDGTSSVTASGGTAPYTYLWNNGATTASVASLTANTYTVTITDNNGCSRTDSVTLSEPTLLTSTTSSSNISCNGGNDGTATVNTTGGTAPYTFLWNNGAVTSSISGLTANTYTVTITDNNGCSSLDSVNVTEPALLIAISSATDIVCFGGNDGTATVTATGGTAPYTYLWNNGATTSMISNLAAGTYSVTVTDTNGCYISTPIVTVNEPIILSAAASSTDATCFGGNDGTATVTSTGGTAPYTYQWSNNTNTVMISGLIAGTYSVVVTDNNGCTASALATIDEPNALMPNLTSTYVCHEVQGTATANASGGTAPYTYLWANGATTPMIPGLNAGSYPVTITDANGCTNLDSVQVLQSPNLFVYARTAVTACMSVSTALAIGGSPGYTFSWTQAGNVVSTSNPAFGIPSGFTSLMVTDTNGCTAQAASLYVNGPIPMTVAIQTTNLGTTAIATPTNGTAPYSYSWDDINSTMTNTLTALPGYYTVTITDANGCTATESVTITAPQASAISMNAFPNPFSENVTLTLKSNIDTEAEITVYSLTGDSVEDVYSGEIVKDETYMFKINEDGSMKSGVYIYRIITPEGVQHHRLIAN